MKKFALLSFMLFIAIILTACGSGGSSGSCEFYGYPNTLGKLTLSKDYFKINKGSTDKIIAYVDGKDKTDEATFTVKSEKEDTTTKNIIANIDKGTITAIKTGTAVINVHIDNTEEDKTFTVNVIDPTLPTLQVVKNEINYEIGQDITDIESIIVTLNGQDVTDKVNFTSTDENVATVDENGNINIIGEGETQIIIHLDGANDQIVTIKVTLPELEINKNEINLQVGQTEQLTVKLKGEDKTQNAVYQSSDPNVATVDENGNITAVGEGKTEITVKVDGAKEAIISVTVPHQKATLSKDSFNIMLGNSEALPDVTLRGEPATCQFQSSDTNVVTIDENGNIKTVGVGETTITTTCNGDDITIPIKVYDTLTTTATNSTGETININTKVLAGEEADNMKIILRDTGMIDNENAVQNIVQIDKTSDVGDVTIDIDAKNDTQVAVISTNQDGTIDYVSTETVQNGKITISSVSNKNIHEVATTNEDGTLEMVETAGFYDANNKLIASWDTVVSWGWDYTIDVNDKNYDTNSISIKMFYYIANQHTDLLNTEKIVFKDGITEVGGDLFYYRPTGKSILTKFKTMVLPNHLETPANHILSWTNPQISNINIRSDNPHFESVEGIVYSDSMNILCCVPPQRQTLIIPNSVNEIGDSAFANSIATSFGPTGSGADIEMPNTITTIGNSSFAQSQAVYIQLPESVTTIHSAYPFLWCSKLQSVYLPINLVTIIQEYGSYGDPLYLFYGTTQAHVYIGSASRPSGWQSDWNKYNNPVTWGVSRATYENNYRN